MVENTASRRSSGVCVGALIQPLRGGWAVDGGKVRGQAVYRVTLPRAAWGGDEGTMGNRNTQRALNYHEGTKHSYASIRTNLQYLDWQNKPLEFKVCNDLPVPPSGRRVLSIDFQD